MRESQIKIIAFRLEDHAPTIWQYDIWSHDIKTFGFPGIEFKNLGTSSEVKSHQGDQSQNFVGKINYRKVWAKLNFEDESTTFKFIEFIQQTQGFYQKLSAFIPLNWNDKSVENISSFF